MEIDSRRGSYLQSPAVFDPPQAPDEKDISAKRDQAQTNARFPRPHGDARWPQGVGRPPGERPEKAVGLANQLRQRSCGQGPRPAMTTTPDQGDYRFPPSARLTRKAEFDRVFRRPCCRLRSGPLRLIAAANRMCASRLGIVAPRRVLRRAVDRNRAKRQIRESFRHARGRLPNCDIVIVVTGRGEARQGLVAFRQAADDLWERLCKEPGTHTCAR